MSDDGFGTGIDWDDGDDDASPICGFCGVSALAPEQPGDPSTCENADCDAFGEPI